MCGIAGIYRLDGSRVDRASLDAMTHTLRHRGPDGEACWIAPDGSVGLGHRRLAIVDLSAKGAQPMCRDDRFVITYNGEIYNYVELRRSLCSRGHRFSSESDTEVLLASYQEFGASCLEHLEGMFAFAIWDSRDQKLFCARDRFGEKPFHYVYEPGRVFAFASEMKSLFRWGSGRVVRPARLYDYLAYGLLEDARDKGATFFEGIRRLPAAHALTVDARSGLRVDRYWSLPASPRPDPPPFEEAREQFRGLFVDSVRRRLRSDVPVGSSLSGGVDSGSVVCTVKEILGDQGGGRHSFSARFDDPSLDEGPFMDAITAKAGSAPHFVWPTAEGLAEHLDHVFFHQEEPFISTSVYAHWEVMRLAREAEVKVLLDGQGADETLGGYEPYFRILFKELYATDRTALHREQRAYATRYGPHGRFGLTLRDRAEVRFPGTTSLLGRLRRWSRRSANPLGLHPEFRAAHLRREPPVVRFTTLHGALRYSTEDYGLEYLLRFGDRNSMAFGREIRLPFLSHELVEFAFSLPARYKIGDGWTKRILRHAMADTAPDPVVWRVRKLGFEAPQAAWLATPGVRDLVAKARSTLVAERILMPGADAGDPWRHLMAARLFSLPHPT